MFEIIYPNYFKNLMIQRPQQLLKEFGKQGYKAVLYNKNNDKSGIVEAGENFYIYNKVFPLSCSKNKRVLWISYPPMYREIGRYDEDFVVFDFVDYPADYFSYWQRGVISLMKKSDIIFVTSDLLYNYCKGYKDKTYICGNGADISHFSRSKILTLDEPDNLKDIRGPIVGYIGAVAPWIDWKLIKYIALRNKFSIVFIGPLLKLNAYPLRMNNVYFLGQKKYEELPRYLNRFNVCIIPFKKNRLTKACNPVKMYEYLSGGKPVVTTDISECRNDIVKSSDSYEDFFNSIISYIEYDCNEEIEKRVQFAEENSWINKVKYIKSIIETKL